MRKLIACLATLSSLASAACSDDGSSNQDASPVDSGTAAKADATAHSDAAANPDATTNPDATSDTDATTTLDATTDADASTTDAGAAAATFTQVYAVIQASCGCHIGGTRGGLTMPDQAAAFTALVSVPAEGAACVGNTRVVPNNATNSVLYRKVSGINLCGGRMPAGGAAPLSAEDQAKIESWINAGALNN